VKCFWKMLAFQRGPEACDGREILYLNVDETSVPYTARPAIGCVINRKQYKGSGLPAVPHAKIQPAGRLSSKVVKAFKCLPKTQLQVLRRKSAWVTSDLMIAILQEVAKELEPFLHQFRHPAADRLVSLKTQRQNLKRQLQQANREVRNEEKKRQRLMRRAGKLSSADLTWLLARRVQSEQSEQMST
ncbi:unnamed protein product, partial [Durusdinium trenchii]